MMTRTAVYRRALLSGKSVPEAVRISREYMDFNQGGRATKVADRAIPYLNAGIQGTRANAREFSTHPKRALIKAAQVMLIGAGLQYMRSKLTPDADESIWEGDKTRYFCFTTPWSYMDKEGNKRYIYIVLPKDQVQQILSALGEEMMRYKQTGEFSGRRIGMAAMAMFNLNLPPIVNAYITASTGVDPYTLRPVWSGQQDIPDSEKARYDTAPLAKWLGSITGKQPVALEQAAYSLFPSSVYTWAAGNAFTALNAPEQLTQDGSAAFLKLPFVRAVVRVTPAYNLTDQDQRDIDKFGIPRQRENGSARSNAWLQGQLLDARQGRGTIVQRLKNDADSMAAKIYSRTANAADLAALIETAPTPAAHKSLLSYVAKRHKTIYAALPSESKRPQQQPQSTQRKPQERQETQ
jgi:hypothetical protein